MWYKLIQDDINPSIQMYYVMEDGTNNLINVIDINCNECEPPVAHSVIEQPVIPPCIKP